MVLDGDRATRTEVQVINPGRKIYRRAFDAHGGAARAKRSGIRTPGAERGKDFLAAAIEHADAELE